MSQHPFLEEILPMLERTPATLNAMLRGLPAVWTDATDGPNTWSAYDVLGHLIHGEHGDWMTRLNRILQDGPSRPFDAFDREAQFRESAGKSLDNLLDEFTALRQENLAALQALHLTEAQLQLTGTHPVLGAVTARQLLSTWTAHDMAHVLQISRTMARRFRTDVGPWAQFLSVMNQG
jgi:uncharacterized damage-inducible protein DinB